MSMLDAFFDQAPEGRMARKLGITKKEVQDLFAEFDTDGSGSIDATELQQFAASFGLIWDAGQVEEALKEMDADGNGTVDLQEFATWFCKMPDGGESKDTVLKYKMQAKLFMRQISKAMKDIRAARPGKECKNEFTFGIGDVDTDKSSGAVQWTLGASSSKEYADIKPPKDAYVAAYLSLNLSKHHSDDDVKAIQAGIDNAFETFVSPMLGMIPPPPAVPGLKEAKGYHSYEVRKEKDQLKIIVFSDVDVASMWRDTGLEVGEYVPTLHMGGFFGSPLALLNPDGGCSIADLAEGKFEASFKWNTRLLHAAKAIASTKVAKTFMGEAMGESEAKMIATQIGCGSAFFRSQNSSFELQFNGFQEAMEAIVMDVAFPQLERKHAKSCNYDDDLAEMTKNYWCITPLPRAPTEDEVGAVIKAVGGISGKTFGFLRQQALDLGPVMPNPMFEGDWESMEPCTLLYPAKKFLETLPDSMPFVAPFMDVLWLVHKNIAGFNGIGLSSEVVAYDFSVRGFDWFHLIPTKDEIDSASALEPCNKEEFMMGGVFDHLPVIVRWFVKEVVMEASKQGLPVPPLPPPIQEKLEALDYDKAEMDKVREGLSEVFDIIKALLPLIELVDPAAPILQEAPLPAGVVKDFALASLKKLIN